MRVPANSNFLQGFGWENCIPFCKILTVKLFKGSYKIDAVTLLLRLGQLLFTKFLLKSTQRRTCYISVTFLPNNSFKDLCGNEEYLIMDRSLTGTLRGGGMTEWPEIVSRSRSTTF